MRYALRNQHKIKAYFEPHGQKILDRIIKSLDKHFENDNPLKEAQWCEVGKHDRIIINDEGHSCACIAFYVIGVKYDVCLLAFDEFIG